jgi:2Fe-2S ferredoxin
MPTIVWKLPDGSQRSTEAADGDSLMLAATFDNIPGIDGDCGGCMSCATCQVVVDPAWIDRVGVACGPGTHACWRPPRPAPQDRSRLSCQIVAHRALDGLVLHLPA